MIASSDLTGEPLTCEEMICVIASSDLTGEPLTRPRVSGARETRIASQDTDAAPELDEDHRRSSVREKGHLSQTVVMSASVEQANTVRPGREEAGKAMGLVRGMVSRRRVGGRRNAGQEGAARKRLSQRHEESSRHTEQQPWHGGSQERSKSRTSHGHRMSVGNRMSHSAKSQQWSRP